MEWTVVTVIAALVGLGAAIIKPIVSLSQTITHLNEVMDRLSDRLREMGENNHSAHGRIWAKNEEQDKRLDDHDRRLDHLEHQNKE